MSPEARNYVNHVLDYIERHALMRDRVDMAAVRLAALAAAEGASDPADTHPAIRLALERLGDRHSFFMEPEAVRRFWEGGVVGLGCSLTPEGVVYEILPESPAAAADIRVGDRVETVNDQPWSDLTGAERRAAFSTIVRLTLRRDAHLLSLELSPIPLTVNLLPEGHRLASDIGYLNIPAYSGDSDDERGRAFAASAQQIIREIDREPVRGWIVDLRRNSGGTVWPMIAAVGPLLGDGSWEMNAAPEGRTRAGYQNGTTFMEVDPEGMERRLQTRVGEPYHLRRPDPPVAVLTSAMTASSGEFVALCFCGLSRVRSFGEPTAGVPTANQNELLPDGAMLLLTVALGVDRAGQTHDGPLPPDEYVATEWHTFGTDRDPVLQASVCWLSERGG